MLLKRSSETPQPLVVSRSLVQEVKGGGEDELRLLDAGQVELEHIFAVKDSFEGTRDKLEFSNRLYHPLSVISNNENEFPACHSLTTHDKFSF